MYLKSITLKNFKKFRDLTVNFPSDVTIVFGPNEQGKSTLLSAVLAGLFYDPKKSNKDIQALKSWHSDKLYEISAAIENNGESIFIYKNFETGEQYLENKTQKQTLKTFREISDYLYEIGGLRSQTLFESTACVAHDALPKLGRGSKYIAQALEELVTSGAHNISADTILKKIETISSDMQKGLRQQAKYPGLLKQLEDKIIALKSKKEQVASELNEIGKNSGQLENLKKILEEAGKNLEIKESQYLKNNEYFKAISEIQRLNLQMNKINADFNTLGEIERKKNDVLRQLEAMKNLHTIDLTKFYNQKETLWAKKEKLSHFQKETQELLREKKTARVHIKKAHLIAAILLMILGFVGFIDPRFFSAWFLFLISFAYSFLLKHGFEVHKEVNMTTETGQLSHEISLLEKQLVNVLAEYQVKSEEELIAKVESYNQLGQELEKLESKEEGILRGMKFDDLRKERDEFLKKIALEEMKISDEQKASPPPPQSQRQLEIEIKRHKQKIDELNKAAIQTETAISKGRVSQEDLVRIEEEIESMSAQKSATERKIKVLDLLSSSLTEARKKTIEKSRSQIEDYIKKYLPLITDNRYNEVKINDDLSFEVWSREKKSMIAPDENLSRGTLDQFYLIARFAVLDLLNKGIKSLILLDDPFHNFDAERKRKAREIINDLSSKFQFIIFSHSSEYEDWGETIKI